MKMYLKKLIIWKKNTLKHKINKAKKVIKITKIYNTFAKEIQNSSSCQDIKVNI